MVAAGEASGQGFAGVWEPTLGTGPCAEVRASVMFDFDGDGPEPAVPVVSTGYTGQVLAKRGGQWTAVGALFTGAGHVNALAVFDPDGDGPLPAQLIAGGEFQGPSLNIARWNGTEWAPMALGFYGTVYAMTVFDPDDAGPLPPQLIAGGRFTSQGVPSGYLNNVARWNGTSWQPLGSGVSIDGITAEVHALATFDPDGGGPQPPMLIVGGTFSMAGGVAVHNIASWDGASWAALGDGVAGGAPVPGVGIVSALLADDVDGAGPLPSRLIVGGSLNSAGGTSAGGIAQWDGAAWSGVGTDDLSRVFALVRFDPDGNGPLPSRLIAAKDGSAGSPGAAGCVVAWDGAAWQPVGGGVDTGISSRSAQTLVVDSNGGPGANGLIAGGYFKVAGGQTCPDLAQWDGTAWQRIASERSGQGSRDIAVVDNDGAGPLPPQLVTLGANLLSWSGSGWQALDTSYATGFAPDFLEVSGPGSAGGVQRLVAGGWVFDEDQVRIGTSYWQTSADWEPAGPENVAVRRVVMFDVDGDGPQPAHAVVTDDRGVYLFDGTAWTRLGGVVSGGGLISALAVHDPDGAGPQPAQLFIAGSFTSIGGVPLNRVARWDGAAWQPLGNGLGSSVFALASYDADGDGPRTPLLIAGGSFTTLGGQGGAPALRLAQWDGTSWQQFADGVTTQPNTLVRTLVVSDPDGGGPRPPELFAAGTFTSVAGVPVCNVARWDGAHWHAVGDGVDRVDELRLYTPPGEGRARLVAFNVRTAGRWAAPDVAQLSPFPSPADLGSAGGVQEPDGAFDNNDFIAFINLFFAGDANADIGRAGGLPGADGLFDNNDFIAFISFFFAG